MQGEPFPKLSIDVAVPSPTVDHSSRSDHGRDNSREFIVREIVIDGTRMMFDASHARRHVISYIHWET